VVIRDSLKVSKAVVHTDVLIEHLCGQRQPSILRLSLQKFFCYTTVFQAIEVFSLGRSESEFQAISDAMAALKVLGLNAKNARRYGELIGGRKGSDRWNLLIAGLCLESRLPLITDCVKDFRGVRGLVLIPTRLIPKFQSGDEILGALKRRGDRKIVSENVTG